MKSERLFVIILGGLFGVIVGILYVVKSVGSGMGDNATHYINGMEPSKRTGMFLGYYKAVEDSLELGSLAMKTERIWYEKNWTTNHDFLLQETIKIDPGIHFIAPYPSLISSALNIDVFLKEQSPNCLRCGFMGIEKHPGLGYTYTISTQPDTLVLLFTTKNSFRHKDTITYVRE